jgi:hypothetical protein
VKRSLVVVVLGCLTVGVAARAEEHVVTAHQGTVASQWVYGGRRSLVTGEEPQPGKDGPWRVRVKVKNGDYVLFTDSTVVFENGKDEVGKVWEVSEFLDGSKGKFGPLTDPKQKAYYKNPDRALLTEEPSQETARAFFLIRIKNLTADRPILFASGQVSHLDKGQGNKHFMFGAIELDTTSR